jgi:hypothetical protein
LTGNCFIDSGEVERLIGILMGGTAGKRSLVDLLEILEEFLN